MGKNRYSTQCLKKRSGQTSSRLLLCERKCKKQQLVSPYICLPRDFSSLTKLPYWSQFGIFLFLSFAFVYVENTPVE